MNTPERRQSAVLVLALTTAMGIFWLDSRTPLGLAEWLLYLLPLLVVSFWGPLRAIYILAAVYTGLIVAGLFVSPPGLPVLWAGLNRILMVGVLWLTAFLLHQRRKLEQRLLVHRANLEKEVAARTADLQRELAERTRAQDALQRSEEKFSKVFHASPIGMAVTRQADGRFIDANSAYTEISGYAHAELVGRTSLELGLFDSHFRAQLLRRIEESGYGHGLDGQIVTKSGAIVDVLFSIEPFDLGGEMHWVTMAVNMSERKRMEQALRDAVAALVEANAGKDAFMDALSHELRTPLTGILGMSEVLKLQIHGALNETQMRSVEMIQTSGNRLLEMINSILRYTALVGGKAPLRQQPCRLDELCASSISAARPKAARKKQTIELEIAPGCWEIRSDAAAITSILDALLDNAIKFTPQGGRVGIQLGADGTDGADGTEAMQVVVWDTGIGIREEQRTTLFTPFTQADQGLNRQFGGIGLGLAYVRAAVARLGGAVAVESRLEEGSRFVVTLPAAGPS